LGLAAPVAELVELEPRQHLTQLRLLQTPVLEHNLEKLVGLAVLVTVAVTAEMEMTAAVALVVILALAVRGVLEQAQDKLA